MFTTRASRLGLWVGQCALIALGMIGPASFATENYPDKTIRMVVPYPPGGPTDIIARSAAMAMADVIDKSIMIDNRAGASGMIGADQVARAKPDGYTILGNASLHVINPHVYKSMSYDSFEDFVPITQLAAVPLVLVVPNESPIKSVADVVDVANASEHGLNFGSAGTASSQHLSGELFKKMAEVDMQHVPYKGSAPALTDLIGGQIDLMFDSMPSAMPFIKSGQLRAIAVTTKDRVSVLPDVPTIDESGFPGYDTSTWYALWAPKGTPEPIVEKLAAYAKEALAYPAVIEQYEALGAEPVGSSPTDFAAYTRSEEKKWAELIRLANVVPQ